MMMPHDGFEIETIKSPDDPAADFRMISDLIGFALVKRSRLAKNLPANSDFSDVMQNRPDLQIEDPFFIKPPLPPRDNLGIPFDSIAVPGCVCVFGFD